jgi:hypothetical protein
MTEELAAVARIFKDRHLTGEADARWLADVLDIAVGAAQ